MIVKPNFICERNALLQLPAGCLSGKLIQRHKRFSVEVELENKTRVWAHCNNSGAMLGLLKRRTPVLISPALSKKRKLLWTLERVWIGDCKHGFWVGVNTSIPNKLLAVAFAANLLDFAKGYKTFKSEVKRGESRLDACLNAPDLPNLWVECKSVTLVEDGVAAFPDAVSQRAKKHLEELEKIVDCGERGAMFFVVQRPDSACLAPADYIDKAYADTFWKVLARGVEAYAFEAEQLFDGVTLGKRIKIGNLFTG